MSTSQRQRSVSYIRLNGLYSYFPTQEDLAVHKRKVNDVRQWLVEAFQPSKLQKYRVGLLSSVVHYYRLLTSCFPRLTQRLLVLTGPAGSGKTTTLRVLTRELGFEILEWRNPLAVASTPTGRRARFGEFSTRQNPGYSMQRRRRCGCGCDPYTVVFGICACCPCRCCI